MNTTVLRWLALSILFSIAVPRLTSQSVIFSEDFESAGEFNGATTGTSAEGYSWNSACPNCVSAPGDIFQTVNGILRGQDTNGPATFSVNSIDASGCLLVTWQFDYNSSGYSGSGNLECADECPFNGPPFCSGDINDAVSSAECLNCWDFLAWEVSSGSVGDDDVVLGLDCNAAASGSVESPPLCVNQPGADPSNLDLTITMSMWATEEFMEIDNITILCYTEQEANDNGIPIPVECQSPVCDIVIDDVFLTDPSCANTTDGEIEIDASGTGLSGSLEYSITNGSSFQSGNIFSNLGPGTYDIVVQDDNDPGCFATTSVTLTGTVIPNPSTPPPLIICFSTVPPDGEILNLAEIIDEIRNFDPSYTVNFYFDMAGNNAIDLTDPADILALISMMPTTIFATITDGTCESMTVAVSVDLNNYPDPPNGMLEACSTGGDATFTLSDADGQFTGGDPGLSVSYHNTLGNAENGTSPIFTVTTPANLTVFVRVENSAGCASTAELDLIATTVDTPNNASLSVCDDGSGQGVFDLTSVDGNVLGGASGSVIYYENSGLSIEITDPANFISGPTTVFAVIDNGSGCLSDAAEVTLDLISFDINDAFLTFDPNGGCGMTLVTLELNTPSDPAGDYTFDISYGPISTGVNNSIILTGITGDANFTLGISETYIFQINSVTGPGPDFCEILLSPPVEYIIEIDDAPAAFPATIIACEDGSGEGFFDLTSLEDIINGNTSNNVTFFQDIDLITPINNPSNYLSAEGTIFAVVESSIGCFSLPVPIQLFLEEIPDPVDINLSTDNACGPTMTVLTFQLPNGDFYDFDLLITDAIGTTVVPLTSVANQSTFAVNVTETTTFSIEEITSEEGCNFTLSPGPSVTISINEPPFAEIILDQAINCNGDNDGAISLDIFGVSPFNVDWSDDDYDDLTTLTGLMAGTYDVTVTDDNGCTITTSITLDEPDQLILDCVANDVGEGNGIGSYTFSYSGGTPIYTLDLNGPTNLNFTENTVGSWDSALLPPGDYTFTITDQNGCSEVCTFNIPVTCDLSVAIDGFDPNCTDEASGSIELTINSSQPIANIDWNIDEIDGEANPIGLTEGTYSATVTDQANCSQDISITLTDPAPLILDCNPNSAGEGSGLGSYTFSYSGGTPFYTLELTGPVNIFFTENNPGSWDTAVLMPGDYTFVATDQNGCSESCTFTIPINCDFTVDIEVVNPDCAGEANGSIDLTINSNLPIVTIDWNVDEIDGEANPTGLAAGTYTATIIDQAGCIQEISVLLNDPAPLVLDCHPNGEGEGNGPGSYTFSYSGGTPGYILNLNGPNSGSFPENNPGNWNTDILSQGNYIFIITDQNGCSESCAFTVPVNCNFVVEVDGTDPSCANEASGSIDLTIIDNQPIVSIDWNVNEIDGETNPDGLTAGTYTVIVHDLAGCSEEASITLNDPPALVLNCNENSQGEGNGPGSYTFSFSGGTPGYTIDLSGPVNISFIENIPGSWDSDVLPPGEYIFTVTDQNGCSISCPIIIPGNCNFTVNIDSMSPSCTGDADGSINLIINSNEPIVTIDWNLDEIDGELNPTGLSEGTYHAIILDQTGCSEEISITLSDPTPLDLDCRANTANEGSGIGSYTFFYSGGTPFYTLNLNGPTSAIFTENSAGSWDSAILPPGDYTFTLTDQNGCSETCSFNNPVVCDLMVGIDGTDPVCGNEASGSIDLTISSSQPIVSIDWNFDDIDGESNPTNLIAGTYTATITDLSGCSQEVSFVLNNPSPILVDCSDITHPTNPAGIDGGIDFVFNGGVAPFTISWAGPVSGSVMVNTTGTIPISNLSVGTYTITVVDANGCMESCDFMMINNENCNFSVEIFGTPPICSDENDGTINLILVEGTADYIFDWSDDTYDSQGPTGNLSGLAAGTYSVTITDASNCIATNSITLSEPAPAYDFSCSVVSPPSDATSSDGSINVIINSGPGGVYTITYDNGMGVSGNLPGMVGDNIISNLPEGDYQITISNGTCEVDCDVLLENDACTFDLTILSTDETCVGEHDGILTAIASGGQPPYTFLWSNGETTATIDSLPPANYTVTVTDGNNCLAIDTKRIFAGEPLPTLATGQGGLICTDSCYRLPLNFTGQAPFVVDYQIDQGMLTAMVQQSFVNNTDTLILCPESEGINPGDFTLTFTHLADANCSDTLTQAINFTYLAPAVEDLNLTICPGDSLDVNGQFFFAGNTSGQVLLPGAAMSGCDSIVNVNIDFYPENITDLTSNICAGDTLQVGEQAFYAGNLTGVVTLENADINGCDSIINVMVIETEAVIENINPSICPGDSILIAGVFFSELHPTDTILLEGQADSGCDSLVAVSINILPEPIGNLTLEICPGDSITFNGLVFSEMMLTDTVSLDNAASNGCDSLVIVNTNVLPEPIGNLTLEICPGDSITFNGVVFSEMMLTDTVTLDNAASNGCDSLVIVNTNVLPEPIGNLTLEICPGDSITFNGVVFSEMMLTDTVSLDNAASNGCDSLVIVNTNVLPEPIGNLTLEICPGDSITFNGVVFSEMMLTDTVTLDNAASNGCDSLVIVNTNVLPEPIGNLTLEICPGDSITFNGLVFSEMMLTDTVTLDNAASNGCDSLVIVDLNILAEPIGTFTADICPGDSLLLGGEYFHIDRLSDTLRLEAQAINGCDSILQVNLEIADAIVFELLSTLCPGDSLMVGDTTIRDAGQYEVLLMGGAASGCDSIVQVDLMYYPPAVSDFVSVACASDTIQVGDQQFTIDDPGGTVTLAGAASNGCDSLVVVDITFLPNSLNSIDSLLCFGESLLVGGTLFDADNPSGVVFLESSSATGCDSTIFVNTSYQNELFAELSPDITICGDQEATVLLQLTAGDSYSFQIDQTPGSSILETNISSATYTIDLGTISSSTTLSLSSISAASGCPVTVLNEQSTINYSDSQLTLSSVGGGLNGNDISCADAFDGAINLSIDNGIGPFTYLWNNGATEANLTGLGAGTYSVTVNDLPGCSTTAEITLNAPPPIVIIATGEAGGCEGTNTGVLLIDTIFGGNGPYEYSIDGQFFSAVDNYPVSIANLASGGYTIYVQDANDCQSNLPIGVPNGISLQLELGDDVTISLGDSVLLNPLYDFVPASWNWTPDIDISQPDTFVTYAAPQETTVYQLEMADENGCTTIDQIRIFVENNIDIFIPNAFAPTGSGGNEKLTIYAGKGVESIERFQIFDRWGNQVFGEGPFQPNDPTYGWDGRLNGQIMNAAVFVYYVEVLLTNGKTVVLKGDVMLMR